MNRYYYQLIAPGRQRKAKIGASLIDVDWACRYYSDLKYVVATTEEIARVMIREKLKGKWSAFIIGIIEPCSKEEKGEEDNGFEDDATISS